MRPLTTSALAAFILPLYLAAAGPMPEPPALPRRPTVAELDRVRYVRFAGVLFSIRLEVPSGRYYCGHTFETDGFWAGRWSLDIDGVVRMTETLYHRHDNTDPWTAVGGREAMLDVRWEGGVLRGVGWNGNEVELLEKEP